MFVMYFCLLCVYVCNVSIFVMYLCLWCIYVCDVLFLWCIFVFDGIFVTKKDLFLCMYLIVFSSCVLWCVFFLSSWAECFLFVICLFSWVFICLFCLFYLFCFLFDEMFVLVLWMFLCFYIACTIVWIHYWFCLGSVQLFSCFNLSFS